MNALVCERLMQNGSLLTYLEQEADLAESNAGGKLRHAILTGGKSDEMMAAVRAMAIVGDAVLWPALRALKVQCHISFHAMCCDAMNRTESQRMHHT